MCRVDEPLDHEWDATPLLAATGAAILWVALFVVAVVIALVLR